MGWHPDIEEVRHAVGARALHTDAFADDVHRMGWFWRTCHEIALEQLSQLPQAVVVSHRDLSLADAPGVRTLSDACGLQWSRRAAAEVARWSDPTAVDAAPGNRLPVAHRSPRGVRTLGASNLTQMTCSVWSSLREMSSARSNDAACPSSGGARFTAPPSASSGERPVQLGGYRPAAATARQASIDALSWSFQFPCAPEPFQTSHMPVNFG